MGSFCEHCKSNQFENVFDKNAFAISNKWVKFKSQKHEIYKNVQNLTLIRVSSLGIRFGVVVVMVVGVKLSPLPLPKARYEYARNLQFGV